MEETVAEKLAKKQRSISVAEFFEKNKQILGFGSVARSLISTVKEAVDNALDACEEADILPDIMVEIKRSGKDVYRVIVEDNGPGIVKEQISKVFGKLLYGSRFYTLKQSRGQQGIGISAAVLYGQITTGKPTKITSRIGVGYPANYCEMIIDTKNNEPDIVFESSKDWDRPHGTRIEVELVAYYIKGRKQSVHEYLRATSIVNPHARITFIDPDGEMEVFERSTDEMPRRPKGIKPHPYGIELGTLLKMLRNSENRKLAAFLYSDFSRIGRKTALEICERAGMDPEINPRDFNIEDAKKLLNALKESNISAPPLDCLSPIGEELMKKGIEGDSLVDFILTTKRSTSVYSGNPFLVEVGLAYGGSLTGERVEVMRYANKVPLLYGGGGCAITHAIERINWKNYGLSQSGGGGIPYGPMVILVHLASTKIPFTSESKDAIADVREILDEAELGVKEVARGLRIFKEKEKKFKKKREKEEIIKKILPKIVEKTSSMLEREPPDISRVIARIMGNLLVDKEYAEGDGRSYFYLDLCNYSNTTLNFKIHERAEGEIISYEPEAKIVDSPAGDYLVWSIKLKPRDEIRLKYTIRGGIKELKMERPFVDGVKDVTIGGRCFGGQSLK